MHALLTIVRTSCPTALRLPSGAGPLLLQPTAQQQHKVASTGTNTSTSRVVAFLIKRMFDFPVVKPFVTLNTSGVEESTDDKTVIPG